jgi:hypothetical protein
LKNIITEPQFYAHLEQITLEYYIPIERILEIQNYYVQHKEK